jgi:hypothetical protein
MYTSACEYTYIANCLRLHLPVLEGEKKKDM